MAQDDLCEIIIKTYYEQIYYFCYCKLNKNKIAAEDCTQETFLVMLQKKGKLDLSGNMMTWLYKTADRVILSYLRKEKKHANKLSLEDVSLPDDGGLAKLTQESPLDCLTPEERQLLTEYYMTARGQKQKLAAQHGMSLYALYDAISRIKQKVIYRNSQK